MRAFSWLLFVLVLPSVAATEPTDPYVWSASFDAPPELGRTVTLTLTLDARGAIDAPLALDVPDWIDVEEPREWRARSVEGERVEHSWRLTPTRAGFWAAGLAVDAARAEAYAIPVEPGSSWQAIRGCCLLVWSVEGRGIAGARPEQAVPGESTVGYHPTFRALDAQRAELELRISPQDGRYAGEEILVEIPPGREPVRAPADAPHVFAHAFDLAAGGRAQLAAGAWVRITFETGVHAEAEPVFLQRVACATFHIERTEEDVRESARTGCDPPPTRSRGVPAPSSLLAVGVATASLALAARRSR